MVQIVPKVIAQQGSTGKTVRIIVHAQMEEFVIKEELATEGAIVLVTGPEATAHFSNFQYYYKLSSQRQVCCSCHSGYHSY